MLVILAPGAQAEEIAQVTDLLKEHGYGVHAITGAERTVVGATGGPMPDEELTADQVRSFPFVAEVHEVDKPYRLAARDHHAEPTVIDVRGVKIGEGQPVVVMAGPCTVESREQVLETARAVKALGATVLRGGAYKPSTSPYGFPGMGVAGLEILAEAREETGMPVITEVMDPRAVETVCQYADILQIGTRNMQNYDLLREVGQCRTPVCLKRGMSAKIEEWLQAAEYVLVGGNPNVMLCERGIRTFETHTRNTLDLAAIPAVRALSHLPVIVDPSQGTGRAALVSALCRGAVAVGSDALLIEVHPHPERALKDGPQQVTPDLFARLMAELAPVADAVGRPLARLA
jgi:phospho-2-dehydro-3-deoxyheptonate aldolase